MNSHTTMRVHRSAVGHVIGRGGSVIKRLKQQHNVRIANTPFTANTETVTFCITGDRDARENAYDDILVLIAASNEWCRKNSNIEK